VALYILLEFRHYVDMKKRKDMTPKRNPFASELGLTHYRPRIERNLKRAYDRAKLQKLYKKLETWK